MSTVRVCCPLHAANPGDPAPCGETRCAHGHPQTMARSCWECTAELAAAVNDGESEPNWME